MQNYESKSSFQNRLSHAGCRSVMVAVAMLAVALITLTGQPTQLPAADAASRRNLADFLRPGESQPGSDDPRRDDSALLKRALASGPGTISMGPGIYRCADVTVPSGVQLVGAGPATVIYANSLRPVFSQKNVHDWVIRDVALDGGATGHWHSRDDDGKHGLVVDGCWSYEIAGVTLRNFDGVALQITRTNLPEAAFSNGGKLDRVTCTGNYAGIRFDFRGEYVTATHLNCSRNMVGCFIHAGNTNISTSNFCGNGDGLVLSDKENGSHGTINGCLLNHNERYALRARNVENGMTFTGCCFYYGAIELLGCRGINVANCQINCHVTVAGQSTNRFSGNYIVPAEYQFRFDQTALVQDNFTGAGLWKATQVRLLQKERAGSASSPPSRRIQ